MPLDKQRRRMWSKWYEQTPTRKEYHRMYETSEAGKITRKRYRQTVKAKEYQKRYMKDYENTPQRRLYYTEYRQDRERQREIHLRYASKLKSTALALVGRGVMECVNCGCDGVGLLEIHHKNGGGGKERRDLRGNGLTIFKRIARGERSIEDLELRCKVCNVLHYVESRWGKLPMRIIWEGNDNH